MLDLHGELCTDEVLEVFLLVQIALGWGVGPVGFHNVLFLCCIIEQKVEDVVTTCVAVFVVHSAEGFGVIFRVVFVVGNEGLDVKAGHLAASNVRPTVVPGFWNEL